LAARDLSFIFLSGVFNNKINEEKLCTYLGEIYGNPVLSAGGFSLSEYITTWSFNTHKINIV